MTKLLKSRSISCQADNQYVNRLKALAALKGMTLARLVREALDKVYGDDLSSFFAESVASENQTSSESFKEREPEPVL